MPTLYFEGQAYQLQRGESVLNGLLRHGCAIPHSCQAGICQSCVLEAEQATQELAVAQKGLSERQQGRGAFMSCQMKATEDMDISRPRFEEDWLDARLIKRQQLCADIFTVTLSARCQWQAGQYFALSMEGRSQRFFSPCNLASSGDLQLLFRMRSDGAISRHLGSELEVGGHIQLRGPLGGFLFEDADNSRPLLFIGESTGIAPLAALAHRAAELDSHRSIHIYAVDNEPNYQRLLDHLLGGEGSPALSRAHSLQPSQLEDAITQIAPLSQFSVYLCGSANFVRHWQRQCFIHGAPRPKIFSERFLDLSDVE